MGADGVEPGESGRVGRPPRTSASRLEEIGLQLFSSKGFDETTIDDVAAAAGIGRRTFFRYFSSKNELVWGDFDGQLARFRQVLAAHENLPLMQALRAGVVEFNRVDAAEVEQHRRRMHLIFEVPALQAYSTLRYAAWRAVVAEFVAVRTGAGPSDLLPRLVGHAALAASVAAYEQWLATPGSDLADLLQTSYTELSRGFAGHGQRTLSRDAGRRSQRRDGVGD
ncbi:MAG TPA: mycofactocin system transcriptional regulator [Kineosporiaceae bacterium]